MTRFIQVTEAQSGLDVRLELLDELAPRHAEALWQIAQAGMTHHAIHAMWTGPEISCPILETSFPNASTFTDLPQENATSYPRAGEIATVFAPKGTWRDGPPGDFFDIGLFYGEGARLLMPMGWIMASVSARVVPDQLSLFQKGCQSIRRNGACQLRFLPVA
jgi:Protein of unknown function (DUF3830)